MLNHYEANPRVRKYLLATPLDGTTYRAGPGPNQLSIHSKRKETGWMSFVVSTGTARGQRFSWSTRSR